VSPPRAKPTYDCFAIAAPGLESLVEHELRSLGVADAKAIPGGVEFKADASRLASVQLRTRTASRVIVRLAEFKATAFHELERVARKVEWARVLPEGARFRLRVTCRKSRLYHSDAVGERIAAAIVKAVKGAQFEVGAAIDDDRDDTDETGPTATDAGSIATPAGNAPAGEPAVDSADDGPELRAAKAGAQGFNPWAVASKRYAEKAAAKAEAEAAAVAKPAAKPVPKPVATVRASSNPGDDPAQLFVVRFDHDVCTISADASGELLHRRGYRLAVGRAPLRETLAAAMLLGAEWDPTTPLVDPMCGSGTIAIEAAMIARRLAPGLGRNFASEKWTETPANTWTKARDNARAEGLPKAAAPIIAADRDEGAITNARANAARAGVLGDIEFRCASLSALEVPDLTAAPAQDDSAPTRASADADGAPRGLLLANPPYGIRVGETKALRDLFARFGQVARERCAGWRVALLSADRGLDAQVKLPFTDVFATSNGGIAVRLVAADVPQV